jgi:hypothetical protein
LVKSRSLPADSMGGQGERIAPAAKLAAASGHLAFVDGAA